MRFENMRISTRLYVLSGLAIAALVMQLAVSWSGLSKLGILQDEGYRRASDSAEIQDISHIGEKLYLVIADSIINRNIEQSLVDWNQEKESALKGIAQAAVLADTPEEKQSAENAKRAAEELIAIYETQLLPQLKLDTQVTDTFAVIRKIDGDIDSRVVAIQEAMLPLKAALDKESSLGDATFDATRTSINNINLAISLVTLALLIMLAWLIIASIFRQLGGEPAHVVEITRKIANGDLTTPIQVSAKHAGSVLDAVKTMQTRLAELIHEIYESSSTMSSSAEQLAAVSQQTFASSGQQSTATSSIAAAMEQLTVSIEMVAQNAKTAESIALQSGNTSEIGEQHVSSAVEEMRSISEAVEVTASEMSRLKEHAMNIGNVMSVIGEVAEQTNLLALNAAIEAARAGDSGRGFAVVADEVRKLAERTANSAKEISSMVESIQTHSSEAAISMEKSSSQVSAGVEVANLAGDSIKTIRNGSTEVLGAISEISHALSEQKIASTDIARNLEVIARMTDEHATAVSEVASTAGHLKSLAGQLRQSVSGFRLATAS